MLTTLAVLLGLIGVSVALDATVNLQCDNEFWAYISTDGGSTFGAQVSTGNDWPTQYSFPVPGVTADTVIRVKCTDYHIVGGFISQVAYGGVDYVTSTSTTTTASPGNWQIMSSTDNNLSPIVYTKYSSWNAPWIAGQSWVWNTQIKNTMIFEFDFGLLLCDESQDDKECMDDSDCNPGISECMVCCATGKCHNKDQQAAMVADSLMDIKDVKPVVAPRAHHKANYDGYYNIIIGGVVLFILINNIFICYWCVCKNGSMTFYKNVKVSDYQDEQIDA